MMTEHAALVFASFVSDNTGPWGLLGWLALVFVLVLLNGFFVAAEFALVKVRGTQLETLAKEGKPRAAFVQRMTEERLDAYLSACQLGITIASLALGWVGEPAMAKLLEWTFQPLSRALPAAVFHAMAFVIAFSIVTALHIVVGEQVPKVLAIRKSLPTSLWVAWPLQAFYAVFRPAIWLLNTAASWTLKRVFRLDPLTTEGHAHSAEELRLLVEETSKEEVTDMERGILVKALQLSERHVRDIMTPRTDVVCMEMDKSFDDNLAVALRTEHSRFPLIDGHLDKTLGVIMVKDMARAKISGQALDLPALRKPVMTVPEMMKVDRLLDQFLKGGAHLAVVVDEHGGSVGIVCLEDVLEEVVGEIRDEYDLPEDEKRFEEMAEGGFRVHGGLALYELANFTDLELEASDVSTIGGYFTQVLGRLPRKEDEVIIKNYVATVESMDGRRVHWLRFVPQAKPEAPSEEAPPAQAA